MWTIRTRTKVEDERKLIMSDSISLREYIEKIIDEREKYHSLALSLASKEIERRLEALNELREEVTSDRAQFIKEDIYAARNKELDGWRNSVDKAIVRIDTKSSTWAVAIVIFVTIIQIALRFWK